MNREVASASAAIMATTPEPANPDAGQVGRYAGIVPTGEVAIKLQSITAFSNGLHRNAIRGQCGGTLVDEKAAPNRSRGAVDA
jgi:hypothetical protein